MEECILVQHVLPICLHIQSSMHTLTLTQYWLRLGKWKQDFVIKIECCVICELALNIPISTFVLHFKIKFSIEKTRMGEWCRSFTAHYNELLEQEKSWVKFSSVGKLHCDSCVTGSVRLQLQMKSCWLIMLQRTHDILCFGYFLQCYYEVNFFLISHINGQYVVHHLNKTSCNVRQFSCHKQNLSIHARAETEQMFRKRADNIL